MSTWLRAALALQLLFFVGWGGRLMTSHIDGRVVWLETEPVDPRDLLSGNYVALRFRIASQEAVQCEASAAGNSVWIHLYPTGDRVPTAEGDAMIWAPTGCAPTAPPPTSEVWIAGQLDPDGRRIHYGIERMFVAEDSPLRNAQSGTVVAKVAINERSEPRLVAVVPKLRTEE